MEYRPRSIMAAQYSLPYTTAATLLLDPQDPRSFSMEAMACPEITALMDRVSATRDPELDHMLPAQYAGGVRLKLKDGRTLSRILPDSIGTPERPLDRTGIIRKFRALTSGLVTAQRQEVLMDAVFTLQQDNGVSRLTKVLRDCI